MVFVNHSAPSDRQPESDNPDRPVDHTEEPQRFPVDVTSVEKTVVPDEEIPLDPEEYG